MFNLNFDICLVHFHAILAEITVLKRKQTLLERPRISWKGPIKTNWITITIFSRLLFQLVGWFDEVMHACIVLGPHFVERNLDTRESYADNVVYRETACRVHNIDRHDMWWQQMNSNYWSNILSIVWFHVAFVLGDMHLLSCWWIEDCFLP
jgi:hypothetical protein